MYLELRSPAILLLKASEAKQSCIFLEAGHVVCNICYITHERTPPSGFLIETYSGIGSFVL
jgi:hypothetical protein